MSSGAAFRRRAVAVRVARLGADQRAVEVDGFARAGRLLAESQTGVERHGEQGGVHLAVAGDGIVLEIEHPPVDGFEPDWLEAVEDPGSSSVTRSASSDAQRGPSVLTGCESVLQGARLPRSRLRGSVTTRRSRPEGRHLGPYSRLSHPCGAAVRAASFEDRARASPATFGVSTAQRPPCARPRRRSSSE